MNPYTLHIPEGIERQLQHCRASMRQSIRDRLQEIVESADARPSARRQKTLPKGPPLRLYVFEGYRVSYEIDPLTRSVVVLDIQAATS
jgi:mRNA-degrading endonuclease RelE of RelBE toxin-antitoxin system